MRVWYPNLVEHDIFIRCIQRLNQAKDTRSVKSVIEDFLALFNFKYFSIGHLVSPAKYGVNRLMVNNWPEEYSNMRIERGTMMHDPTVLQAVRTRDSFTWSNAHDNADKIGRDIIDECRDFAANDGFFFSYFPVESWPGCFSIGTDEPKGDIGMEDRELLRFYGLHAFGVLERLEGPFPNELHQRAELSAREREILTWAAAGKSLPEISVILDISPNTAKRHVQNAASKLGTTRLTSAVSIAQSAQIILP